MLSDSWANQIAISFAPTVYVSRCTIQIMRGIWGSLGGNYVTPPTYLPTLRRNLLLDCPWKLSH